MIFDVTFYFCVLSFAFCLLRFVSICHVTNKNQKLRILSFHIDKTTFYDEGGIWTISDSMFDNGTDAFIDLKQKNIEIIKLSDFEFQLKTPKIITHDFKAKTPDIAKKCLNFIQLLRFCFCLCILLFALFAKSQCMFLLFVFVGHISYN